MSGPPSPYQNVPLAQRPPHKRGRGRRAVPPGIKDAIAVRGLAGAKQAELARDFGVSKEFVRRVVEDARSLDLEDVRVLTKALPDMARVNAALALARQREAVEDNEPEVGTRWAFQAKLNSETIRHVHAGQGEAGTTVLHFIDALKQAGGGALIVAPEPGPSPVPVIETTADALEADPPSPEDSPDMPT
jgi:hypothetical protein